MRICIREFLLKKGWKEKDFNHLGNATRITCIDGDWYFLASNNRILVKDLFKGETKLVFLKALKNEKTPIKIFTLRNILHPFYLFFFTIPFSFIKIFKPEEFARINGKNDFAINLEACDNNLTVDLFPFDSPVRFVGIYGMSRTKYGENDQLIIEDEATGNMWQLPPHTLGRVNMLELDITSKT